MTTSIASAANTPSTTAGNAILAWTGYTGNSPATTAYSAPRSSFQSPHRSAHHSSRSLHRPASQQVLDDGAPLADINQNALLAALPAADQLLWKPYLQRVDLHLGQVLYESGCTPTYVYFPTSAIVSLMCMTQDGKSAEIAVVGRDGVVGISMFMGGNTTPSQAVVQSPGQGWRIRSPMVLQTFSRGGPVLAVLLRYAQAAMGQMAQIALCNRHHYIEQQLCRRLLQGLDRSDTSQLTMTHELLARLLGVRRESVTAAAHRLQLAGVIDYARGHVNVLNRPRLQSMACECYVAQHRVSLFPSVV